MSRAIPQRLHLEVPEMTAALDAVGVRHAPSRPRAWRLLLPVALGGLAITGPWSGLVATALADAFVQVTVFVAWTLAGVVLLERWAKVDLAAIMIRRRALQYPIAALLGGLPGCGGAVIVTTQFVRGQVTFGALVAVLVATMGDAAFLLIARSPAEALLVIGVCMATGVVSGVVADRLHGPDFLRTERAPGADRVACAHTPGRRPLRRAWWLLIAGGLPVALLVALQVPVGLVLPGTALDLVRVLAVAGTLASMALWALGEPCHHDGPVGGREVALGPRVIGDTALVATWVAVAYVAYTLVETVLGLDLSGVALLSSGIAPALGVIVGLVPGCGPQILFTTLYLAGSVPLSAMIGNAISNDGDALFPALAVARRAAVRATAYSAVPALLVGYGWYGLFDGGLA